MASTKENEYYDLQNDDCSTLVDHFIVLAACQQLHRHKTQIDELILLFLIYSLSFMVHSPIQQAQSMVPALVPSLADVLSYHT
jgi:hypothetical protein